MAGNQVSSRSATSTLGIATSIQDVTSITLSSTTKSVTRGASDITFTLSATIKPDNTDVSKRTLTWTSSNTTVATVDQTGKVTVKSKGTANITATSSNGKTGTCILTAIQQVTSISLANDFVITGTTATINKSISPTTANNQTLTWSSSNTNIATVNTSGVVTGLSQGTTTITATANDGSGVKSTCTLTVHPTVMTFNYTGNIQNITLPKGIYKLEVWGAQGGSGYHATESLAGGKGGYSVGTLSISSKTNLFVVVGGQGSTQNVYNAGYNGGGANSSWYDEIHPGGYGGAGGGATHIATATGELKTLSSNKNSILLVAGGGGGSNLIYKEYGEKLRRISVAVQLEVMVELVCLKAV